MDVFEKLGLMGCREESVGGGGGVDLGGEAADKVDVELELWFEDGGDKGVGLLLGGWI